MEDSQQQIDHARVLIKSFILYLQSRDVWFHNRLFIERAKDLTADDLFQLELTPGELFNHVDDFCKKDISNITDNEEINN